MANEQTDKNDNSKQVNKPVTKRKTNKVVAQGIAYVDASFNNTKVSITDPQGNLLSWSTAGANNFSGSRKGTPYAGQLAAQAAARKAVEKYQLRRVAVRVVGPGTARDMAIRGLHSAGLEIISLEDRTPLPHNGCRPRKKRRV